MAVRPRVRGGFRAPRMPSDRADLHFIRARGRKKRRGLVETRGGLLFESRKAAAATGRLRRQDAPVRAATCTGCGRERVDGAHEGGKARANPVKSLEPKKWKSVHGNIDAQGRAAALTHVSIFTPSKKQIQY